MLITHETIKEAIMEWLGEGNIPKRLPPQEAPGKETAQETASLKGKWRHLPHILYDWDSSEVEG